MKAGGQESIVGRSRHRQLTRLKCAAAALVLAISISLPDNVSAQAPVEFRIEGGPLRDALTAYARVTRRQLLYPSSLVAGRTAPVLRGLYGPDEALQRLLAGTGISVRRAGNAYVLAPPARQPQSERRPAPARRPATVASRPTAPPDPGPAPAEDEETAIVVTGTNVRGQTEGPSPVQIIDRDEIERAGQGTVAEAIAALPQNFGGTATEDTVLTGTDRTIQNPGLGSSANLRGLGSDATLTLINGRRLPGAGSNGDFTDLSLVPLSAVERIEVLTDGASAIYGSDAIGGVVNIILRRDLEGGETRFRVGTVTQGTLQDVQLGQVLGTRWSTGSILAAYEFQRRDNLPVADRSFTRTADLRPLGGDDFRSFFSNPGTIIGLDPAGALVPRFAIPSGQDGTNLSPSDFTPGANLSSALEGTDLLPEQTRHSAYLLIRQEVVPGVELFAEGRYGRRRFEYASPAFVTVVQVGPSNPFFVSPDGSPFSLIAYSFRDELGPVRNEGLVSSWSATGGVSAELGGDWHLDADLGYTQQRTRQHSENLVNASFLSEAAGMVPDDPATPFNTAVDGFFNPYGDGAVNGPAILDFLNQGFINERINSRILTANLKVDGRLLDLPGGPLRVAVGGAYRRESFFRDGEFLLFGTSPTASVVADTDRTVIAAFGEVIVPIFGRTNARPGFERLELSGAIRYERYSDFGSSTNPRVGIVWEPISGLRLRSSYGTSFRAPGLRELNDPTGIGASQLPDANGNLNTVIFLTGGNPDLESERARSLTIGAQIQPPRLRGFRAAATFFETRFDNRIGQPAFEDRQLVLRDSAFSPFVTLIDPANNPADRALVVDLSTRPGSTVPAFIPPELFRAIVDGRNVNTARVVVRGLDFSAIQNFRLGGGDASVVANLSYLFDFQRQPTPAARLSERVDTVGNPPDLRMRVTASWDRGSWGATATANYVDGYRDDVSRPERSVDAWLTVDAQLRYQPNWSGWLAGTTFSLSVQNLFDSDPPFVNRPPGQAYDAANADPLGRFVAFQIVKRW